MRGETATTTFTRMDYKGRLAPAPSPLAQNQKGGHNGNIHQVL